MCVGIADFCAAGFSVLVLTVTFLLPEHTVNLRNIKDLRKKRGKICIVMQKPECGNIQMGCGRKVGAE